MRMVLRGKNGNGNYERLDILSISKEFHISVTRLHVSITGFGLTGSEGLDVTQVVGLYITETGFDIFHGREEIRRS